MTYFMPYIFSLLFSSLLLSASAEGEPASSPLLLLPLSPPASSPPPPNNLYPSHLDPSLFLFPPPPSPSKHAQLEHLFLSHVPASSRHADRSYNRISDQYQQQQRQHDQTLKQLEAMQRASLTIPFLPPPSALYNELLEEARNNRTDETLQGTRVHNTAAIDKGGPLKTQKEGTLEGAQQSEGPSSHHHPQQQHPTTVAFAAHEKGIVKGKGDGGAYAREKSKYMRTAKKRKNRKRYMFGEHDRNRHFYDVDDDCYWRVTVDDSTRCVSEEDLTAHRETLPSIAVAKDFTGMYSTPEEAVYGYRPECANVWLDRNSYTYYCIPDDSKAKPIDYLYERYYKEKMDKYRFYVYAKEAVQQIPMPYS
eukprot:GHVS01061904.1.p1 GENE.GHVS01061904.1~~GHVS01061904.1.p1  ORF type:complete len:364 (-),score=75.00 GHVS01061904.1:207-1298(-)